MATQRDHERDGPDASPDDARGGERRRAVVITAADSVRVEANDSWPLIESFRTGDKFVLQADVPGMSAHEIEIELTDTEVIISGERRWLRREGADCQEQERIFGPFRRRARLPEIARPETARAALESGVLTIELDATGVRMGGPPKHLPIRQGTSRTGR
jgi:HSP20 family protein